MKITVAICCYNSEKVLDKTLKNLRELTPNGLSVLVIDDGSSDETGHIAEKNGSKVIRHGVNQGYGAARQSALENCETEIIAFIDDSCIVAPDWYTSLVEHWSRSAADTHAIIGKMEIFEPVTFFQKFMARHNPFLPLPLSFSRNNSLPRKMSAYLIGKRDINAGFISGFSNGNASFRTQSLEKVGGYDTRYRLGAEDEDIAAKLQRSFGNHAIYYDSSIKVFHDSTYTIKSILIRNYRYGKSAAFRYSLEKGTPLILPIPVLAILTLFLSLIFKSPLILFFLLIFITLSYLPRTKINVLTDTPVILLIETFHFLGFCVAVLRNHRLMRGKQLAKREVRL
jgi:glycosyltransferase involved in cell wall biosynthesis